MSRRVQRIVPTLKYVDICEELRRRIETGVYQHGERLPSQPRLAEEFDVALLTLRQALQLLESQGFLCRKSGSGTYASRPEPTRQTALVVDDDIEIRELLRSRLERMGWSVDAAKNGKQALQALQTAPVDLIFLNPALPGMDGAVVFRHIRQLDPEVPVVMITGYPDGELMSRALRIGPFAVVQRPFRVSDIKSIVKSLFGTPVVEGAT